MPKGPKGQKRPADVVANAVKVMRIATGEEAEEGPTSPARHHRAKTAAAARSRKLTDTQRADIARVAAEARWKKSDG
ncbi:MAG: hypothetical protein O9325_16855 [Roseomonas sp.]|nr:hypothetical protein [Roseomonas sp.]